MALERVYLIGLSGTGKSTIAPLLADRLGFTAIDIDAEIERLFARPIPRIFADFGEPVFRAAERELVRETSAQQRVVIATGGGVVLDDANWAAMRPKSVIIHLTAPTSELVERLKAAEAANPLAERPLLRGDDPAARIAALWEDRQRRYQRADATVDTGGLTVEQVVAAVADALKRVAGAGLIPVDAIGTPLGCSDLYASPDLIAQTGRLLRQRWPDARRAWIISDATVLPLWGDAVAASIRDAGLEVETATVPAGEASKALDRVRDLLDWLIGGRVERGDVVVALGGGVVGDLGGFVASIVLRGIGLVQIPTSLLAMVDSSVGGKTGINHAQGKNLIGSFYQPPLVIADPLTLRTLPERELRAGWAEIVKHALIECSATGVDEPVLLPWLERIPNLLSLDDPAEMAAIVGHNIRLKAAVVRADEREMGLRRLLNYGHTLGHAMEAADYRYLHGEAIALGLRAAARLALRLGLCNDEVVRRQDALLDRLQLPSRFDGALDVVLDRLTRDKKAVRGTLTWVLPTGLGRVTITRDVPAEAVAAVARELGAT